MQSSDSSCGSCNTSKMAHLVRTTISLEVQICELNDINDPVDFSDILYFVFIRLLNS